MINEEFALPVECAGKYEIVINREFVQRSGEVSLVNQTTGFVDDYQRINNPGEILSLFGTKTIGKGRTWQGISCTL